jgi:hypothetical protein
MHHIYDIFHCYLQSSGASPNTSPGSAVLSSALIAVAVAVAMVAAGAALVRAWRRESKGSAPASNSRVESRWGASRANGARVPPHVVVTIDNIEEGLVRDSEPLMTLKFFLRLT